MINNNKIYTISLVFTIAILFLVMFFVLPLLREIEKNSKDLISAKNNVAVLAEQTNETENFKKNYETYAPNLEKIDQLFVDPNNPVDFIKFLEDTASTSQITSQISLQPSPQDSQQSLKGASQNFIIFRFASKGGFSEVLNFLKKIEAGPYLVEIENLTIQNSEVPVSGYSVPEKESLVPNIYEDNSSRKVDATFTIKVFVKPR